MERHDKAVSPRESLQGLALMTAILAVPAASAGLAWLHGMIPLVVMSLLATFGTKQGGALLAAALLLAGAIAFGLGSLPALLFAITLMPAGFLLARGVEKNEPPGRTGLKAALSLGGLWLLAAAWYGLRHGINPYLELRQALEMGFQQTLAHYQGKADMPAEALRELSVAIEATRRFLARALPAVLVASVITTVWLNMLVGCWLLKKTRPELVRWPEFKTWRLPEALIWPLIVALGLLVASQEPLATIGLNLGYVLGLLYLMQGLAILAHLLERWQMPRLFRGLLYGLLLIQLYGMFVLVLLGVAETWFALRKEPEEPAESP